MLEIRDHILIKYHPPLSEEEKQAAAEEALAEVTYLQGVYDALEEGLADVQRYIAGN